MTEDKNTEYKSLKKVVGKTADIRSLAETCVCFANAQGGKIIIGIENRKSAPDPRQQVSQNEVNDVIKKLRSHTDSVGIVQEDIITHENGGQYFVIKILPTSQTVATTSTGKVYIRVSDSCVPVSGSELTQLAAEKSAFQWELATVQKIKIEDADTEKTDGFLNDIRDSDKVST